MMSNWNGTGTSSWWIVMCLVMMATFATVAVVAVLGLRGRHGSAPAAGAPTADARAILDERLARGDITAAEHHELADALAHPRGT